MMPQSVPLFHSLWREEFSPLWGVLYSGYASGYFPIPEEKENVLLWIRPQFRCVLPLGMFHVSRSLQSVLRKNSFKVTVNQNFEDVLIGCANRDETWITREMMDFYRGLHRVGTAHSVEAWKDGALAGGVFGVQMRGVFFAESMFYRVSNGSKVALWGLTQHLKCQGFSLLECQILTPHLQSLGAVAVDDAAYMVQLEQALRLFPSF